MGVFLEARYPCTNTVNMGALPPRLCQSSLGAQRGHEREKETFVAPTVALAKPYSPTMNPKP